MRSAIRVSVHPLPVVAATLLLAAAARDARAQTGLELDGTDDYVTFGAASGLGVTTFTAEAWIFRHGPGVPASTGTGGVTAIPIFTKGRGQADGDARDMNFFVGIRGTDSVLVADYEEGAGQTDPGLNHPVAGLTPIRSQRWYHVAAAFDGTTWTLYLNGQLEATLVVGPSRLPRYDSIQHAALGSALTSSGTPAGFFDGVIDEARLWNYARSQEAIAESLFVEVDSQPSGLKGRWGLNEGTGTTAHNDVLGGSDGTLVNGPVWGPGSPFDLSGSLDLGASGAFVAFGDPAALDLPLFTIETWFRRDGPGVAGSTGSSGLQAIPLVAHGTGEVDGNNRDLNFFLGINETDGVLCADFEEGSSGSSPGRNHPVFGITQLATGEWHHGAATYDGTTWRLYLDGALETELAVGQPPQSATIQPFSLGTGMRSTGTAVGSFDGVLDEVRIWDHARSVAEIDSTINRRLIDPQAGLVARWSMDEATGSFVRGSAGTTIDGTIAGTGWSWEGPAPFDVVPGPPPAPALPTDLAATAISVVEVALEWIDTSNNETGFEIERSTEGPAGPFVPWTTVGTNTTSWSDVGVEPDTESCYRVRAVNPHASSDWTAPACATTPPETEHALAFGGADAYVDFGPAPSLGQGAFTIEAWLRRDGPGVPASTGSGGVLAVPLVAKGVSEVDGDTRDVNWFLGISGDILVADFEEGTGGAIPGRNHPIQGSSSVGIGVWRHAAVTYDGATWRLYLDGGLENELFVGQPPQAASIQHAALASALSSTGASAGHFDGALDEVRVWSYARTQFEIHDSINERIATPRFGLVGRWALNEGIGATVYASAGTSVDGTIVGAGWTWAEGAPFDLVVNRPPASPTPVAPPDGAVAVPVPATLDVVVSDPDAATLDVTFHGRPAPGAASSPFSLVVLPDTQYYSAEENGGTAAMFRAQTDWIVAHRDSLEVAFVLHVGDIVEHGDEFEEHWANAWDAMSVLEDPLATGRTEGIPYSVAVGSHDQSPAGDASGTTNLYNQYFGTAHFAGRSYWGGAYGADNDNHLSLFSAGGLEFVVVTLEYDPSADAAVLAWADSVLAAHPARWAIVNCHSVAMTGNPAPFAAQGQAIYDALKDRPNLFLMVGGHHPGEGRRSDVFEGRTVHSLNADYQERVAGGNGWLRVLTFDPDAGELRVSTYSPTLDRWETDVDSDFTLPIALVSSEWQEIGSVTGVASGDHATIGWDGLGTLAEYEWYVEATDGSRMTAGPVCRFTTRSAPPTVQLVAPNGGETVTVGETVSIQWTAADDVAVTSVDLWLSRDGVAGTYEALALGVADTGSYDWVVTAPGTVDAWVKVVAWDAEAGAAEDVADAAFTIVDPTGAPVVLLPREFGLHVASRHPLRGGGTFSMAVPREAAVRLELFDVRGRRLATLADGTYPPGVHAVTWDGRTEAGRAAAGVYFLRLRTPAKDLVRKVVAIF